MSVTAVIAAKMCHIPAIIHESDMTPGLANRLAIPQAYRVCCNFPETIKYLPEGKAVLSGSPIRQELLSGNALTALELCHFTSGKPVLLIIGGSTGSKVINDCIREMLPTLLVDYQVLHLCGKGNLDDSLKKTAGYAQFEYAGPELRDMLALSSLVISRAGANSICELLALRKPNILIPLSANASRGDQILNAKSFENQGYSYIIEEESLSCGTLKTAIQTVLEKKSDYICAMSESNQLDSIDTIIGLIEEAEMLHKNK